MTMTATLTVSPTGARLGQKFTATVTLTNGGGSSVAMVAAKPFMCSYRSAVDQNIPCLQSNVPQGVSVPAGDSVSFTFSNIILASSQALHLIGCEMACDDGSTLRPTGLFTLLGNPSNPPERKLWFDHIENGGLLAAF